jgi:NET1-associated nuclear protein 1 (U3 small nucleolar RNA-associated protein 17)
MQAKSQTLILPSSHPSFIQIYSPSTACLIAELEVSPSNRVSRPFQKRLNPSRVDLIATSDCGTWLATIDMRDGSDEGMSVDVFLKIWRWNESEKTWDLNTKVDRPHGSNKVNSLAFSPSHHGAEPLLASTGGDANVKTWNLRRQTDKDPEQYSQSRISCPMLFVLTSL